MVRFIYNDPMRPARPGAQFLNTREKRFEKFRPFLQSEAGEVQGEILIRPGKQIENLRNAGRTLVIADDYNAVKCGEPSARLPRLSR